MKLAVVILNWNAAEHTSGCIGSVKAWSSRASLPRPTIWVVDNGSQGPGLERMKQEHPDVRFLSSRVNRGFAGGNNLGIAAAMDFGSDAIVLMNNDASVDGQSVVSMLTTLASDPRIGVTGPTLWHEDRLVSMGGRDIARHSATHLRPRQPPDGLLDVDYVSGTVALVSRAVFEKVGLLDEDYFFGGEMADLCLRARRNGFRCVTDPQARAHHDLGRSSKIRETLHAYYIFRNRFLYIRKHYPRQKAWLFALWTARGAYSVMGAVAGGNLRRAQTVALGVVDGLTARFGGQNERVLG
jgi:GT2 family glycosyltransferase